MFRRAANVLQYYIDLAIHRTNKAVVANTEDDDLDVNFTTTDLRRKWERVFHYAELFCDAYNGYNRDIAREKSKMSNAE